MSSPTAQEVKQQTATERDINDLFDDIVLSEQRVAKSGYDEGFKIGCEQGELEGYQLGYARGAQLGEELGQIYGTVVALQQNTHTEKVNRALKNLRELIVAFPRRNDPEADIIGGVENIRTQHKRLQAMLSTKLNKTDQQKRVKQDTKDYSF